MGKKREIIPVENVEKGLNDNIPSIILMGETGVGKSTFIHEAGANIPDKIGHGLASCTKSMNEYILNSPEGITVRLIDMPGFNNSEGGGDAVEAGTLISWLENRRQTKLTCVLLLYDITQPREATICHTMKNPSKIPNPFIVTTKWHQNDSKEIDRETYLKKLFGPTSSMMSRFRKTHVSAWAIVGEVLTHYNKREVNMGDLQIYLESIRPHLKVKRKNRVLNWFASLFN